MSTLPAHGMPADINLPALHSLGEAPEPRQIRATNSATISLLSSLGQQYEPGPGYAGAALTPIHAQLVNSGLRPKLQIMDNEASTAALKMYLDSESVAFQLVPAGMHRRNAAERAIRTFKNHFIAILCSSTESERESFASKPPPIL